MVILGAQTQVDPVDPTVLDEDLDEGSDQSSDTENTDSRSETSDVEGEAEVAVPVERFIDSFSNSLRV